MLNSDADWNLHHLSLQVAPGIETNRPAKGEYPKPGEWYEGLEFGENSAMNVWFYGMCITRNKTEKAFQFLNKIKHD